MYSREKTFFGDWNMIKHFMPNEENEVDNLGILEKEMDVEADDNDWKK